MIKFFITQPLLVQCLILLAHALLVLVVSISLMRWINSRLRGGNHLVPVGPYFVSITTLFALFLAFHASIIWSNQHTAEEAFHRGQSSISRLEDFFENERLGLERARSHLEMFIDAVVHEEWPTDNTKRSHRASQELEYLGVELTLASEKLPSALSNHLWRLYDEVVKARDTRLSIGSKGHNEQTWVIILVLGFLSHIAIGVVHADRPLAGVVAMTLFACATTLAYWILSQGINPFAHLDLTEYRRQ